MKTKSRDKVIAELLETGISQSQIESFHAEIYKMVDEEGLTVMEALIAYCDHADIEPEVIKPLIDPRMMSDLTSEVSSKNLLKPSQRVQKIEF